nr:4'-phosphopantetheinyl transferase superfamily protein [Ktedonobacterales bacterium]
AMARVAPLLSTDEREHAARFRFAHDQQRYTVAHAFVRHVLGAYLGVAPLGLTFAVGPQGKPSLVHQSGQPDLRFNLSHSHDRALLAVVLDREVGVDVEFARPLEDADVIATQFFSLAERAALQTLSASEKQAAFYRCWSRKEAVIKVMGLGLSMPLDGFDVTLTPDAPARLLAVRGAVATQGPWELYDLPPLPGFASAVVVAGGPLDAIECYSWDVESNLA